MRHSKQLCVGISKAPRLSARLDVCALHVTLLIFKTWARPGPGNRKGILWALLYEQNHFNKFMQRPKGSPEMGLGKVNGISSPACRKTYTI